MGGDGVAGYCEPSGYCSFDDGSCPSGRRYGSLAPPQIADACTEPVDDEPTGSVDATMSIGSTQPEPSTSGVTTEMDSSTGTPVDPVTSASGTEPDTANTTIDPTEVDTGTTEASSTSGPEVPTCTPALTDDFSDGELDPGWEGIWASEGCSYDEGNGRAAFTVAASDEWSSAGIYTPAGPIAGGDVRAQVLPFTPPLDVIGVWLSLFDPSGCELQISLENSTVRGRVDQWWFDTSMVANDETIWLQLRTEADGMVHWEWSTDGQEWNLEHSQESPCDLSMAGSAIFAGGPHEEAAPITRAVDFYERCDPQ